MRAEQQSAPGICGRRLSVDSLLFYSLLCLLLGIEVSDDVGTVLLLLEAREGHVGALDVLLRVLEVAARLRRGKGYRPTDNRAVWIGRVGCVGGPL